MRKSIKITLIALLLLLVVFSILTDLPILKKWPYSLNLSLYLKLVSLFGLLIAIFMSWGYRNKVQSSQKYRRADEVISKAQETFERKKQASVQLEKRLQTKYEEKEKTVDKQIETVRQDYQNRLNALQQQNIELKETITKLMNTIKQERK